MITKYKASTYSNTIEKADFARETKSSLIDENGNTVRKHTATICYFDDFLQAKEWVLLKLEFEASSVRYHLKEINDKIGNIKGMKA